MRRCLWLLLLPLLLTACSLKIGAPPIAHTGPAARTETEAKCPPPPPAEPAISRPPPNYVLFGLRETYPELEPGQSLHITAYLKNVAPYPIVLDPDAPVLELSRQQNVVEAPIWSLPLTAWAAITLQPGEEVTQTGEWPGGEPGYYLLNFDRIHFTVACSHDSSTLGGGGTQVHVLRPAGQAPAHAVTPHTALTVDDITVRVDSVVMDLKGTQVTLWVSRIRTPADLSVAVYVDGQTLLDGIGLADRDAQGGGVILVADRAPVPLGTRSLTVEVSDIGLTTPGVRMARVHGPWRIKVPLDAGP